MLCLCCIVCRGANLILSGAYDDFSANWYVDVGQSLQIIIILNAMLTGEPVFPLVILIGLEGL
jgi:hypothetical protein